MRVLVRMLGDSRRHDDEFAPEVRAGDSQASRCGDDWFEQAARVAGCGVRLSPI